jgi:predicted RNA-binding protein with PIN domain
MPYIIDGNNLLWAIRNNDERFAPVDEVRMCWTIGRFLTLTRDEGELVFDGTGPRPADRGRFENIPRLAVSFAGIGRNADDVIEERVKTHVSSDPIVLVSNDRRLRLAAHQAKAVPMKAEAFWEKVMAEVGKKRAKPEPTAKRHGLSESETDVWLKAFGIEEEDQA